jgi:hypothetical protein
MSFEGIIVPEYARQSKAELLRRAAHLKALNWPGWKAFEAEALDIIKTLDRVPGSADSEPPEQT